MALGEPQRRMKMDPGTYALFSTRYAAIFIGVVRSFGSACGAIAFIPIYPNNLPTVPKPSRVSRTASLVFSNLPASQSAITRLLNRFGGQNLQRGFESPPSPPLYNNKSNLVVTYATIGPTGRPQLRGHGLPI